MSEKPAPTKATDVGVADQPTIDSGVTKEDESKKERGLLQVPSRSSSQKNQPSSSTGLSGATIGEARNSIGGRSKDSRSSFLGRQRNGSASSKRTGGESDPTQTPGMSQPSSPLQKKKKSGGFLSFLGCCGAPDSGPGADGENENVHKLDKLPQRPATATKPKTSTSQEQGATKQVTEKEPQTTEQDKTQKPTVSEDADEITPAEGDAAAQAKVPPVTGNSSAAQKQEEEVKQVGNGAQSDDVVMQDASRDEPQVTVTSVEETETATQQLPPPPPVPETNVATPSGPEESAAMAEEPHKWLLPPITPELKGRKCLVLDLDETLVHSSFKILHQADFTIPVEIEGNYHNVYVIKRPGVDEFMRRVGELYEVVVFTASVSKYGDPLLDQLDIHKVVHHRLFRESCYNHQGNYVKDLSQVGRDLKDTIIIDNSPTSYIFHPQHAVPISSWFSDAHDNELLDLIPVLEDLAGPTVADVSLVLDVTL
ncbi:unnamed protein product [Clonostachys solani]|uniref:FCP1 homology domain-containing protein n=1 Tax=Clonostachys solani TaxID=160281 RepID=A0A9N9ZJK5_9HYPO|nr:unnamed protein product [Clonostachys solani]